MHYIPVFFCSSLSSLSVSVSLFTHLSGAWASRTSRNTLKRNSDIEWGGVDFGVLPLGLGVVLEEQSFFYKNKRNYQEFYPDRSEKRTERKERVLKRHWNGTEQILA